MPLLYSNARENSNSWHGWCCLLFWPKNPHFGDNFIFQSITVHSAQNLFLLSSLKRGVFVLRQDNYNGRLRDIFIVFTFTTSPGGQRFAATFHTSIFTRLFSSVLHNDFFGAEQLPISTLQAHKQKIKQEKATRQSWTNR
jgi:hypothetical protein